MRTIVRHNRRWIAVLIWVCCSLCGWSTSQLSAQEPDTTTVKKGPKGFNALQYVNQGIWKGGDMPFSNKRWHDNIYLYAGAGAEGLSANKLDLRFGLMSYVGVGKDITKNHSLRLAFDYTNNGRPIGDAMTRYGLSVSHLFNISGYTMGYDPNRRIEFSTVVGAGFQRSKLEAKSASGFRGWLGFQAKFHAQRHIDYALEPFLGINSYKMMMAENVDRLYQLSYGASLNIRYKWHHSLFEYHNRASHLIYGNFYSAGIGAQMHLSDLEGQGIGPVVGIGFGRWILPGLGLKLTGFAASDTWHAADYPASLTKEEAYQRNENTGYVGGRLEAVFEPFIFFRKIDEEKKFQLRILAGGSFGSLWKKNYNQTINEPFAGPTAALQFAFRCDEDKLLYLEPRFTMVNYSVPYERVKAFKNFADNLVSLTLGMEVSEPIISRRRVNAYLRDYFQRTLLFSLEGGVNMPVMSSQYNKGLMVGGQVGLLSQYLFAPEHSVALHLDYNNFSEDRENAKQSVKAVSAALQYRLDVTNAILGYDPDRKMHLTLFAGPLASLRLKIQEPVAAITPSLPEAEEPETPDVEKSFGRFTRAFMEEELPTEGIEEEEEVISPILPKDNTKTNKFFIGAEMGFQIRYNLTEYLGVYLAPQLRLLPADFLPNNKSGWDKIATVSAGIQFKL